ncbi:MAG TPA: hypothetical protein VJY37_05005, partial [Anaerovoracaceae bacterium]|nr:hypothetical protein [Anaerovoracaceae bacterium]
MSEYTELQNGSDIRGIALDGVPGEIPNLGKEKVHRLTKGFLLWLSTKTRRDFNELTISVGSDSRVTGPEFRDTIAKTLSTYGVHVLDAGLASTPAMFMSTIFKEYDCDGAIMVTASHLPYNRNGFKYFDKNGGLNKSDIIEIIKYAESEGAMESMIPSGITKVGKIEESDLMSTYSKHLRDLIIKGVDNTADKSKPLAGLHIVVDAGNGGGGFFATNVLEPLGADISGSQFLEPDGMFPNHQPNPENKDAMKSICKAVTKHNADLGLIFDTDVDRSAAVDKNGNEISRNGIVALAAALIADKYPGTTVVTDSITSDELTVFLEKNLGLKHLRFKRGYRNVINKSLELNESKIDSQLAIETSGHAAYKENYFLDDGAYLATKIVIAAANLASQGKSIDSLIANLAEPLEAMEVRIPIEEPNYKEYGDRVLKNLEEWAVANADKLGCTIVEPNYEGIRLAFDNDKVKGWCLLRKSLHDPILPLNIEANTVGGCKVIKKYI